MNPGRVLVAGVGDLSRGDDGFGVQVARRLLATERHSELGEGERVTVADFGVRGLDLANEMLTGGYDSTILIAAFYRGGPPGTLYVFEPTAPEEGRGESQAFAFEAPAPAPAPASAPAADAATVLALVQSLAGEPGRLLVLGCEPVRLGGGAGRGEGEGLSVPVAAAVDTAVAQARELARSALTEPSDLSVIRS